MFDQKILSLCWDKLDYPGSIVYLSCWHFGFVCTDHHWRNRNVWTQRNLLSTTKYNWLLIIFQNHFAQHECCTCLEIFWLKIWSTCECAWLYLQHEPPLNYPPILIGWRQFYFFIGYTWSEGYLSVASYSQTLGLQILPLYHLPFTVYHLLKSLPFFLKMTLLCVIDPSCFTFLLKHTNWIKGCRT